MKNLTIAIICFLSFSSVSQQMERNINQVESDYTADNKVISSLQNLPERNSELVLLAEKANDSTFSVYVQNNSEIPIEIAKQDWHLKLIQEAKDKNNVWKPIEYWQYSNCGNSYNSENLKPQQILKSNTKAYTGNFKTEIRFKMLNNSKVYYSNVIKGEIYIQQFVLTDTVKIYSSYNDNANIAGDKIAKKLLFLEPDGASEYLKAFEEYIARMKKKRAETKK